MYKISSGAVFCLLVSLGMAQETPISLYTFRTPNGGVQQHLFVTPNGGPLTVAVFGFNHPNPTFEVDYTMGKAFHPARGWSFTPAFSAEYERKFINAGLFTFTSGREGNYYLALPAYVVEDLKKHQPYFLVPSGRIGYNLGHGNSFGFESKLKFGAGANISLAGGFLEAKGKSGWVRLSYLGKVTGGQNELRLVLGSSF